jgi:hypothetical protein
MKKVWVKCKNCAIEKVCAEVIHYTRGKKRECSRYVSNGKMQSNVPVRKWLWPQRAKKIKKEMLEKQIDLEQQKLLVNDDNLSSQVEANAHIEVKKKGMFGKLFNK